MRSKVQWLVGVVIALVVVTGGAGLYSITRADVEPTECEMPCPTYQRVNDGQGGVYYCLHTGTCSNGHSGQSCDYEPISSCAHFPGPFNL